MSAETKKTPETSAPATAKELAAKLQAEIKASGSVTMAQSNALRLLRDKIKLQGD